MHLLGTTDRPLRVAIIGSGPAGFFAAEPLLKSHLHCAVDMFDRLPVPFGLVRGGVAPDHPKIRGAARASTAKGPPPARAGLAHRAASNPNPMAGPDRGCPSAAGDAATNARRRTLAGHPFGPPRHLSSYGHPPPLSVIPYPLSVLRPTRSPLLHFRASLLRPGA